MSFLYGTIDGYTFEYIVSSSKKYRLPKDRTNVPAIMVRTIQRGANDDLFQAALIFDRQLPSQESPNGWKMLSVTSSVASPNTFPTTLTLNH